MRGDWGKGLGKRIYPECTSVETQLSGCNLGAVSGGFAPKIII